VSSVVLDASALLAVLNNEPGAEKLSLDLLARSVISTVNLAEVHGKLVAAGIAADDAWSAAMSAVGEVAAFTEEHAKLTGTLVAQTRAQGLSLGDRACLSLAISLKAPVYTADRSWKNLRLNVPVHLIR